MLPKVIRALPEDALDLTWGQAMPVRLDDQRGNPRYMRSGHACPSHPCPAIGEGAENHIEPPLRTRVQSKVPAGGRVVDRAPVVGVARRGIEVHRGIETPA